MEKTDPRGKMGELKSRSAGARCRWPVFIPNRQRAGETVYFSLEKSNFASASSLLKEEMSFFD